MATQILSRQPRIADDDGGRKHGTLEEALGHLAAQLWVGRGLPEANEWVDGWIDDIVHGQIYLWPLISALREALFAGYTEETADALEVNRRAHGAIHSIVQAAHKAIADATPSLLEKNIDEQLRQRAENLFKAGESLLDHACNQIYFGSGAFRGSNREDPPGLADHTRMRAFLADYADTLALIGEAATARTLHHLVELYEYLVAAAPELVFERITDLLFKSSDREGYHFESLGSDVFVRLIRRYLADYRDVFEDAERRSRLVRALELFSSAGWPEALKLLYELPELLR